ncbi:uncharacterized protein LOC120346411 [Styela clava]
MNEIRITPNLGNTTNEDPVTVVQTQTEASNHEIGCLGSHNRNTRQSLSRRSVRRAQAVNFLLYGITLMIPGISMIIVYFVVFRIPSGNLQWSPADAFVITGAILVGFSIVAEVIGLWQFCMSRYEPDEPPRDMTIRNNQYSDSPPSYDRIAIDLPDLVMVSVPHSSAGSPPSFESCFPKGKPLPGLENIAYDSAQTDDEELPPPPAYSDTAKNNKFANKDSPVIINEHAGSVKYVTSENSNS